MRSSALLLVFAVSSVCAVSSYFVAPAAGSPARAGSLELVLEGAHLQVGKTLSYDGSYRAIPYPGGDVPMDRGVCTDVIVRAYRHAGIDLQVLIHEDMERAFSVYPRQWGLSRPDPNIDHRRVPNLATFLRRHGVVLPASTRPGDYRPGDIVTWRLSSGVPHVGLVSDRMSGTSRMVIHNIGEGARLEPVLFQYDITGHYRYEPWRERASAGRPQMEGSDGDANFPHPRLGLPRIAQPVAGLSLMMMASPAMGSGEAAEAPGDLLARVDHLVYAAPDLNRGIAEIEAAAVP